MICSVLFFCKQKTAYEMRISDWSSDVCSSDLSGRTSTGLRARPGQAPRRSWSATWQTSRLPTTSPGRRRPPAPAVLRRPEQMFACDSLLRLLGQQVGQCGPGAPQRLQALRVFDQQVELVAPGVQPWTNRRAGPVRGQCGGAAVGCQRQPRVAVTLDLALEGFPLRNVGADAGRSEEHTSELQSLMRISYAVFCLKKKK